MRGLRSSLAVALLLCVAAAGVNAQVRRSYHLQFSVAVNGSCTANAPGFNAGFRNAVRADVARYLGIQPNTVFIMNPNDKCERVLRQVRPA